MASVKYVGPAHSLTIGDKVVKRGESVTLTKELRKALEKAHHKFEDSSSETKSTKKETTTEEASTAEEPAT